MKTTTRARCGCGRVMSKHSHECKACHQARMAKCYAEAAAIVATGKCPCCGTPLRRNQALTGWWQCDAYGEPQFRRPEHRGLPKCSFQTFTAR